MAWPAGCEDRQSALLEPRPSRTLPGPCMRPGPCSKEDGAKDTNARALGTGGPVTACDGKTQGQPPSCVRCPPPVHPA